MKQEQNKRVKILKFSQPLIKEMAQNFILVFLVFWGQYKSDDINYSYRYLY